MGSTRGREPARHVRQRDRSPQRIGRPECIETPESAAGFSVAPLHGSSHVVPAAQSTDLSPLHLTWQAAPTPHSTLQPELPVQSAVQPPFGHWIVHLLLPWHESVDPVSSVILQSLPPPHVTWLLVPVTMVQSLVPAQLDVQFDPQLPAQTDWPSHVFVQPEPQVRSQLFLESQ